MVPTTCDCTRQSSTIGELTIVALSSVSVLKYIWPQIAWAWDSFISFSVQKVLMRLRREKREEERRHPEEQAGGLEELMRLLPQLRGLVGNQHRIVSQSYEKLHYRAVIASG